jgi:hypothetical protein
VAAFLLFVLAVGGSVLVADLVMENTALGQVTVFQQTFVSYPQGWLLAVAAGLGFAVAMLLVASVSATRAHAHRRRPVRRGLGYQVVEREPDHDRLLDEFFGPDETPRHPGRPARPAHLRAEHHPEPVYDQSRRVARLHAAPDRSYPASNGRR